GISQLKNQKTGLNAPKINAYIKDLFKLAAEKGEIIYSIYYENSIYRSSEQDMKSELNSGHIHVFINIIVESLLPLYKYMWDKSINVETQQINTYKSNN